MQEAAQRAYFSLKSTRFLLLALIFVYFLAPALISQYLFDNDFYIYSSYQVLGNIISVVSWLLLSVWVYVCLNDRFNVVPNVKRLNSFLSSKFFLYSYYLFIVYLVVVLVYGIHLRLGGAGRGELLDGLDNFLFPGMSFILLNSVIYILSCKNTLRLSLLIGLFILIDVVFNGKIFSFLAFIILFFRIDFSAISKAKRKKIVLGFLLFGIVTLASVGISRVYLAGEEVGLGLLPLIYTVGSEFLGVQASIGWSVGYFLDNNIADFVSFGSTLQGYYVSSVGHGLATNPATYFIGNFGPWAIIIACFAFVVVTVIYWLLKSRLGWVAALVLALNFQHLLRHGFDVFFMKYVTQMAYCAILSFVLAESASLSAYLADERK